MRSGRGTTRLVNRGRRIERVHVTNSGRRDMFHVARHDDEVMDKRGGGDEPINVRQRIKNAKTAPLLGDGLINVQNTILKPIRNPIHPRANDAGGLRVPAVKAFDAASQFAQGQDAQEHFLGRASLEPIHNEGMSTITLAEFGKHVCVKEIVHRSSLRGPERDRLKSASSPTFGIASRWSMKFSGPSASDSAT